MCNALSFELFSLYASYYYVKHIITTFNPYVPANIKGVLLSFAFSMQTHLRIDEL
jgi:hypothetical protein